MARACSVAQVLQPHKKSSPARESTRPWLPYRSALFPRIPLRLRLCSLKSNARSSWVRDPKEVAICSSLGVLATDVAGVENSKGRIQAAGYPSHKAQQHATLQQISSSRVIACLRCSCPQLAVEAARAALEAGIRVLEVTMTTPSAPQVIEILVREYPFAVIGAGTVLTMGDADVAAGAGAKFLASPMMLEEMVCAFRDGPVVVLPGVSTPAEVISAYECGAPAVKLYPVSLLGGAPYVRSLSRPLSHIPLVVSQGCTLDMVESYIAAGSSAVILSDAIFDKCALESRDFNTIKILARVAASKSASQEAENTVIT